MNSFVNPNFYQFGENKFHASAQYLYDDSISGWRPAASSDFTSTSGAQIGISGNVTNAPLKVGSNSNSTISGTNGIILAGNQNRVRYFVQNLGINPLYVLEGTTLASSVSFSYVLSAGTTSGDAKGGILNPDSVIFTGQISASGIQPNYLCWES